MGRPEIKTIATLPLAALLLVVLLSVGACSNEPSGGAEEGAEGGAGGGAEEGAGDVRGDTTTGGGGPTAVPETTSEEPPSITLGEEPGDRPEAVLRLEGGRRTAFSGLCSVGDRENVLSGRVPKRFTFDLNGSGLSCRIEKRDEGRGVLRIVLVAGDTTRSVQQTNSPGAEMNISYKGG